MMSVNNSFENEQSKVIAALALMIYLRMWKFIIFNFTPGFFAYNNYANVVVAIILLFYMGKVIPIVIKKSLKMLLLSFGLLTMVILVTALIFPDNVNTILTVLIDLYSISFMSFIIAYNLVEYDEFILIMIKFAKFSALLNVYILLSKMAWGNVGYFTTDYNMSLSGYLVIPSIFILYDFFSNKNIVSFLSFISYLIVILSMGSRSHTAYILIFVAIYLVKFRIVESKLTSKKLITGLISIPLMAVSFAKSEEMLQFLIISFEGLGINSRTLKLLARNDITNDMGRSSIYEDTINKIAQSPILGSGFLSLGKFGAHNIVFEFIAYFGIPIGILIITNLLFFYIRVLLYKGDRSRGILLTIFFSVTFLSIFVHSTIIGTSNFFLLLGFGLRTLGMENKIKVR